MDIEGENTFRVDLSEMADSFADFLNLSGYSANRNSSRVLRKCGIFEFIDRLLVLDWKNKRSQDTEYLRYLQDLEENGSKIILIGFEAGKHDYFAGPIFVDDLKKNPVDLTEEYFFCLQDGQDELAFIKRRALMIITHDKYD